MVDVIGKPSSPLEIEPKQYYSHNPNKERRSELIAFLYFPWWTTRWGNGISIPCVSNSVLMASIVSKCIGQRSEALDHALMTKSSELSPKLFKATNGAGSWSTRESLARISKMISLACLILVPYATPTMISVLLVACVLILIIPYWPEFHWEWWLLYCQMSSDGSRESES